MTDNMNVRVWQLMDTRGTSSKFYNIYLAGVHVITQWGRIGSDGQTKVETFAVQGAATQQALKIHNEKIRKGYEVVKKDFDLTIPQQVIANIVFSGGSAVTIFRQTQSPRSSHTPNGLPIRPKQPIQELNGKEVLRLYGHLVTNLRAMNARAGEMDLDVLLDRWGEVDSVWSDLEAARTEAADLVDKVRAQVTTRVMG